VVERAPLDHHGGTLLEVATASHGGMKTSDG